MTRNCASLLTEKQIHSKLLSESNNPGFIGEGLDKLLPINSKFITETKMNENSYKQLESVNKKVKINEKLAK